ncbi:MAG: acyl-CoA dehydrogenase, partial [Saprospiraceae bacterium]|nr:acyl-CoA dehydrogenase [Saprospiraceae bacterium]
VRMVRPLTALNSYDYPGGHWEISLDNVRVPASSMIVGPGKGFEIAQGRLGPGRIHHCMRLIGMAQRTLEYMIKRVEERSVFGKSLDKYSSVRQIIARSFCRIEQARLLTLKAAHKIDTVGIKDSKDLIAAIKVVAPKMTCDIVDEAIQLFGGMGVSNDIPLALFYTAARALRIADGPDEVHLYQLGRNLVKAGVKEKQDELNYFNQESS